MSKAPRTQGVRILLTWSSVAVGVLAVCVVSAAGAMVGYAKLYENRVFPGVRVLGVRLDGLTKTEARKAVHDGIDAALVKGLKFRYRGQSVAIDAAATDPDASRDLVHYDIDTAIDGAYQLGRGDGWQKDALDQIRLRVTSATVQATITIDRVAIAGALQAAFEKELTPPVDASLELHGDPVAVSVLPEKSGYSLVLDAVYPALQTQAEHLDFRQIEVVDRAVKPKVTRAQLEPLIPNALELLKRPQLVFAYEKEKFTVPPETLASWLTVTGTASGLSITLDPEAFAAGMRKLAPEVEKETKNGSLIIKDGKIDSFTPGTEGVSMDTNALLQDVLAHWPASSTFSIVVQKTTGSLVGEDPERLGITELLGVGHSNFAGSPTNRRKNIALGAQKVNGTIIQPDEIFSLINVLGPIDGEHKWLPELVIKGNETKPEFGGGLCQIGTTTFRGALASGLPIIERQNHSYRVRYYEPAGTDATIYDPKPDFRFKNDTGHAILINAFINGDDATFEFWGTRDDRKVEQTTPKVSNIVEPPPVKLVETLDLAPGKKKCTETAHAGADAEFTYTVTYPNGEVKKEVFRSHYRPWQAVCLVGVEKLSAPAEASAVDSSGNPDIPVVVSSTKS